LNILLAKPAFARLLQSDVYLTYPLGLMGVASTLKRAGHEVQIWHDDVSNPEPMPTGGSHLLGQASMSDSEQPVRAFAEALDAVQPDVVGVGYGTVDSTQARLMGLECRRRGIRSVAGGIHPSLMPDDERMVFDAVVIGEGDHPDAVHVFDDSNCPGGQFRIEDGADIPIADRDCVIGGGRYSSFLRGMVQTQRGCPYHCAFCSAPDVFGRKVRMRDPGMVREEVESLGATDGRIIDDSFGVVKAHGLAVCAELEKVDYNWVCDMALKDVDEEMLDALHRAGCKQINIGVESATDRWRELSGKQVTPKKVKAVMDAALARDVGVVLYFMIGWPGETSDELFATIRIAKLMKDLGAKPHISIATPYPGTALWDMCDMDEPDGWGSFMHQSADMGLADVSEDEWGNAVAEANTING